MTYPADIQNTYRYEGDGKGETYEESVAARRGERVEWGIDWGESERGIQTMGYDGPFASRAGVEFALRGRSDGRVVSRVVTEWREAR